MDFIRVIFPTIMDQIVQNLPEIIGYITVFVIGLAPQIAKKIALKKVMDKMQNILAVYQKATMNGGISEAEYAELGKEVVPILDEVHGKLKGWTPWKSK